ncbi:putative atp-dependent rna helicase ddx11 [Hordeum vulgare]|nr:putative atp-dependent rna helicase ddx11 [Hordeum vulgare]
MPLAEFQLRRKVNPYNINREQFPGGDMFWNKDQFLVFEDVIKTKKNMYVPVQWIDLNHLKKDLTYFGEALSIVDQLHIEELITFQQDFDYEVVAHFFAIVHFHTDDDHTMTWLTNGEVLSAKWKDFMDLLHVRDEGLHHPVGLRPHANPTAIAKEKLLPYYIVKRTHLVRSPML